MAQFDVHALRSGGLVVDIQSDFIGGFGTRFVIPLIEGERSGHIPRLNPIIRFHERDYLLATQFAAAAPEAELGRSLGSLLAQEYAIKTALDVLITGF